MNCSKEEILNDLNQVDDTMCLSNLKESYFKPRIEKLKVSKSEMLISFSAEGYIADFEEVGDPVFHN